MRGSVVGVLLSSYVQAAPGDHPQNRYVADDLLRNPLLGAVQGVNKRERLVAQREIPIMMLVNPEPVAAAVMDANPALKPGGYAYVPSAGLWPEILAGERNEKYA